jgi:hypothetical protein
LIGNTEILGSVDGKANRSSEMKLSQIPAILSFFATLRLGVNPSFRRIGPGNSLTAQAVAQASMISRQAAKAQRRQGSEAAIPSCRRFFLDLIR